LLLAYLGDNSETSRLEALKVHRSFPIFSLSLRGLLVFSVFFRVFLIHPQCCVTGGGGGAGRARMGVETKKKRRVKLRRRRS
jgi:hypothetical protein